jgi:hypothetical protein
MPLLSNDQGLQRYFEPLLAVRRGTCGLDEGRVPSTGFRKVAFEDLDVTCRDVGLVMFKYQTTLEVVLCRMRTYTQLLSLIYLYSFILVI